MTALQDKYISVKKFLEEGHTFIKGDQVVYLTGEIINLDVEAGIKEWNAPHPENNTIFVMKLAQRPVGTDQPDNLIHHEVVEEQDLGMYAVSSMNSCTSWTESNLTPTKEDYMVLVEDREWKEIALVFEDDKGMLFDIPETGLRTYHTKGSSVDIVLTSKEVDAVEVLYDSLDDKLSYEECAWVFYQAKLVIKEG